MQLSLAHVLFVLRHITVCSCDRYVAKRYGQSSVLGSYLDPLADKVLIGCVVGALGYQVRRGTTPKRQVHVHVATSHLPVDILPDASPPSA